MKYFCSIFIPFTFLIITSLGTNFIRSGRLKWTKEHNRVMVPPTLSRSTNAFQAFLTRSAKKCLEEEGSVFFYSIQLLNLEVSKNQKCLKTPKHSSASNICVPMSRCWTDVQRYVNSRLVQPLCSTHTQQNRSGRPSEISLLQATGARGRLTWTTSARINPLYAPVGNLGVRDIIVILSEWSCPPCGRRRVRCCYCLVSFF